MAQALTQGFSTPVFRWPTPAAVALRSSRPNPDCAGIPAANESGTVAQLMGNRPPIDHLPARCDGPVTIAHHFSQRHSALFTAPQPLTAAQLNPSAASFRAVSPVFLNTDDNAHPHRTRRRRRSCVGILRTGTPVSTTPLPRSRSLWNGDKHDGGASPTGQSGHCA